MNIETIPSQRIFYIRRIGEYGTGNLKLMTILKERLKQANLFNEDLVIYGIAWSGPNTPKEQCVYDVCATVSASQKKIEGMEESVLESGKYEIYKVKHTKEAVQAFWMEWRQSDIQNKQSFVVDFDRPILERYRVKQIDTGYCEFCVPIDSLES
ncbi:GyrI-like domain-containing protein [Enterococcus rotai]|uniref:GyrI-like domain-containing protein n=2 Tax=Enterococcus rotai TaxID=118060 RepID=UPI0032B5E8D0